MRDVNGYMELPYTVVVRKDEEGDYVATVDELPGCIAHGATRLEALECLDEIQQAWLSECIEQGQPVPEPRLVQELPSGKWVQRVPRSLHLKLSRLARTENVSLNQFVTSLLGEAVGEMTTKRKSVSVLRDTSAQPRSNVNVTMINNTININNTVVQVGEPVLEPITSAPDTVANKSIMVS